MLELICKRTRGTCRKAVALLDENDIPYRYREYTREPLDLAELRRLFERLGKRPRDLLRRDEPHHVLQPARLPERPTEPNITLVALAGSAVGLAFAIGLGRAGAGAASP